MTALFVCSGSRPLEIEVQLRTRRLGHNEGLRLIR